MSYSTAAVVAILSILSLASADIYPGDAVFQNICQEIINSMAADSVPFKELVTVCSGWWGCTSTLQLRETLTKATICQRLVDRHTTSNEAYLGGAVTLIECTSAFAAPDPYGVEHWDQWYGRHCGAWRNVDNSGTVIQTFTDHSLRSLAGPGASPGFFRQDISLFNRPPCCNTAWTESGPSVSSIEPHPQ